MNFCFQILYKREQITEIQERGEPGGKPVIPQLTAEAAPGTQSRRSRGHSHFSPQEGWDVQDRAPVWGRGEASPRRERTAGPRKASAGGRVPTRGSEAVCPHQSWRKELEVRGPWGSPEKGHAFGGAALMKLPKKPQQATLPGRTRGTVRHSPVSAQTGGHFSRSPA